jgi:uncharacterized protein
LTPEVFFILLLIGIFAGVLAGYFGVGGGIIIVPAIIFVYSIINFSSPYNVHIAIATSLFTIIFTTIASAYKHSKINNILWKASLIIGVCSSVSVFIFSKIVVSIPGDTLKKIFAVVLFLIAVRMLLSKNSDDYISGNDKLIINWIGCILIGSVSGIISAFTGLGGGIIIVPMMHYFMKFPIKKAIGTSSAAILLTALSGVTGYFINVPGDALLPKYSLGLVDTFSALPIILASVPFSQLGVYLHKKSSSRFVLFAFAIFIIIVSIKMFI